MVGDGRGPGAEAEGADGACAEESAGVRKRARAMRGR